MVCRGEGVADCKVLSWPGGCFAEALAVAAAGSRARERLVVTAGSEVSETGARAEDVCANSFP